MYVEIYHLNSVICKTELDKKITISRQPKPISYSPIIQGRTILLPYFDSIAGTIGMPHAEIEPVSENCARYTQLFRTSKTEGVKEEAEKSWKNLVPFLSKTTKSTRTKINKGEFFDICINKDGTKSFVVISSVFSIWVS